jgi:hypothetical protein
LTRRLHIAQRPSTRIHAARRVRIAAPLLLALALAGCRHKTKPFVLPQSVNAPVELVPIPPPDSPPIIATLPPPQLGPLPAPLPPPPRRRRRVVPPPAPPVQVASAPEPAAVAIGSLSTGSDVTSQTQQQAKDLLASIGKRIAALPAATANAQKSQVRQVKQFLNQAQQALNSGDAEGAKNLATKANVLMDDIEKK